MNPRECRQAMQALTRWFESQDISPTDAVPVLVATLVVTIVEHSMTHVRANDAASRVAGVLTEGVAIMSKGGTL